MSARRERSTLKSAYLFESTCRCRRCVHACNAVFTQLIKLPPCGSYKASDTELKAIKQWAIDEARFEPSDLPANTPQPPPAKKARAGPLDVLNAMLSVPAASHPHQPRHWFMLNCPHICRLTLSVEQNRRLNGGSKCCQVPVVSCRSQALSQRL